MKRVFAILGGMIAAQAAAGLPTPGADDAGSGMDAPDTSLAGPFLTPGSYEGRLGAADYIDGYQVSVHGTVAVRAVVSSEADFFVYLLDPAGVLRDEAKTRGSAARLSAVGKPEGVWRIEVGSQTLSNSERSYNLTLALDEFEHYVAIETPVRNVNTVVVTLPEGARARLELSASDRQNASQSTAPPVKVDHMRVQSAYGRSVVDGVRWGYGTSERIVRFQGVVGDDSYEAQLPRVEAAPVLPDLVGVIVTGENLPASTVTFGYASGRGGRILGHLLYSGPAVAVATLSGGRLDVRVAADFDSNQSVHQAGPVMLAGNLTTSMDVRSDVTTLVLANGLVSPAGVRPPHLVVVPPNGATIDVSDGYRVWPTFNCPTGAWEGALRPQTPQDGQPRLVAASFPVPPPG